MKALIQCVCLLAVLASSGCVYYPEKFRPEPRVELDIGIQGWNIGKVVFNKSRELESICC